MQRFLLKGALAASIALVLPLSSMAQTSVTSGGEAFSARINTSAISSAGSYNRFIVRYRDDAPASSAVALQNANAALGKAAAMRATVLAQVLVARERKRRCQWDISACLIGRGALRSAWVARSPMAAMQPSAWALASVGSPRGLAARPRLAGGEVTRPITRNKL